jgi:hypothetical protein
MLAVLPQKTIKILENGSSANVCRLFVTLQVTV